MAPIFEPIVRFVWITPHWKAFVLLFSSIKHLTTFYVIYFADFSRFSSISSFNLIQPHLMFLLYLLATNGLPVSRYLIKLKNGRSTMFRESAVQRLAEKYFSVKVWIIIKKICLRRQKINGNGAIFFWYFERTTQ